MGNRRIVPLIAVGDFRLVVLRFAQLIEAEPFRTQFHFRSNLEFRIQCFIQTRIQLHIQIFRFEVILAEKPE